mmetsp:Transcript_44116/g.110747  ORF Transcript_44116/g.110747 Transcript_44116/m.110747 type:complete len:208 (-) Transcript_44116:957-1580(-)
MYLAQLPDEAWPQPAGCSGRGRPPRRAAAAGGGGRKAERGDKKRQHSAAGGGAAGRRGRSGVPDRAGCGGGHGDGARHRADYRVQPGRLRHGGTAHRQGRQAQFRIPEWRHSAHLCRTGGPQRSGEGATAEGRRPGADDRRWGVRSADCAAQGAAHDAGAPHAGDRRAGRALLATDPPHPIYYEYLSPAPTSVPAFRNVSASITAYP